MGDLRSRYAGRIDDETWAFIDRTDNWYPPDTVDQTVARQREIYDAMCREFFAGYPAGVAAEDFSIPGNVKVRRYRRAHDHPVARTVYYHGGGFVVGGLESHDDVCAEICGRAGHEVISVDYRLVPENLFPADFEDAMAGFAFAAALDDLPVLVVGDSAGGNLAAAVSHATRGQARRPVGQVLIYPGLGGDLTKGSYVEHADAPMLSTKDVSFYKNIRTGGKDIRPDPRIAPLDDTDFSDLPPTVIVSAECDPLSDDGRDYRDKVLAAGGKAVWFNEAGLVHGYLRARHSVTRAHNSFTRIVEAIASLGQGVWPYLLQPGRFASRDSTFGSVSSRTASVPIHRAVLSSDAASR